MVVPQPIPLSTIWLNIKDTKLIEVLAELYIKNILIIATTKPTSNIKRIAIYKQNFNMRIFSSLLHSIWHVPQFLPLELFWESRKNIPFPLTFYCVFTITLLVMIDKDFFKSKQWLLCKSKILKFCVSVVPDKQIKLNKLKW